LVFSVYRLFSRLVSEAEEVEGSRFGEPVFAAVVCRRAAEPQDRGLFGGEFQVECPQALGQGVVEGFGINVGGTLTHSTTRPCRDAPQRTLRIAALP